ncbi:hypothetical protein [Micromonospora deserti]|uniref:Thioredoxin domain-containing protein n=1 Tax=Micromonospora deserti TaxID=2070366 RepID=A0A2W2CB85_9ACTN|nr:hypothetical protein [Micromonospora deserti]PZF94960.1 hypothetical protein C1I99_18700 [Micromonospora deserti]
MGKPDADGPGLPDLPPEWGRVVVPDDASALAAEAEQVRRELRRGGRASGRQPTLALPLLVLLVAVLTTLAGLVAVSWPRSSRTYVPATPAPYAPPAGLTGRSLPALDLVDAGQSPVPLRGLLPAMIILVDGCACPSQVAEAATAAPTGVTLITVAGDRAVAAPPAPGAAAVRPLADPAGGLRAFLHLPARPGSATALLVDRSGVLVKVVPEIRSAEDYRADLARLGS